jgi:hypothetical protein
LPQTAVSLLQFILPPIPSIRSPPPSPLHLVKLSNRRGTLELEVVADEAKNKGLLV